MNKAEKDRISNKNTPRVRVPVVSPTNFNEKISVSNERELLAVSRQLAQRLADQPEFSMMLFANPVLALRAYGVELTKELEHHILTSLRHPPALQERRAQLEAALEEALGGPAKPADPQWLANLVHVERQLPAREIEGLEPAYKPPLSAEHVASIRARRPAPTNRYPKTRRIKVRHRVGVVTGKKSLRRLDLDTEVPDLPLAKVTPQQLTLEQAWFYKNDSVVRDVVELGTIMRRGFPFATPDEFRRIAKGEQVNGFRAFIDRVGVSQAQKLAQQPSDDEAAKPRKAPPKGRRSAKSKPKPK